MSEDPRCCGSGTCIIDNQGLCWCGQQWDGEKMGLPTLGSLSAQTAPVPNIASREQPQEG
jgi:hypothetical protein